MQQKVSKDHINNLTKLIQSRLSNKFTKEQIDDMLLLINELIEFDKIILINNIEIPKQHLELFNLINHYHNAHIQTDAEYTNNRTNTLELLGTRNSTRQKKLDNNEIIIKDKDIAFGVRLVAT